MKNKVLIIGAPGCGKSTLARRVKELYGHQIYELDELYWTKGWIAVEPEKFVSLVKEIITQEKWVIDGYYPQVNDFICDMVDTIIYLDVSLPILIKNVIIRTIKGCIKKKEICGGNREKIIRLFMKDGIVSYTIKQYRNNIIDSIGEFSHKLVVIKGYCSDDKLKEVLL